MALKFIVRCSIRSWNEVIYTNAIAEKSENEWNSMAGKQTWHQDFDAAIMLWKIVDDL